MRRALVSRSSPGSYWSVPAVMWLAILKTSPNSHPPISLSRPVTRNWLISFAAIWYGHKIISHRLHFLLFRLTNFANSNFFLSFPYYNSIHRRSSLGPWKSQQMNEFTNMYSYLKVISESTSNPGAGELSKFDTGTSCANRFVNNYGFNFFIF